MVLWMIGLGLGDEGDISVKGLQAVQQLLAAVNSGQLQLREGLCSGKYIQNKPLKPMGRRSQDNPIRHIRDYEGQLGTIRD